MMLNSLPGSAPPLPSNAATPALSPLSKSAAGAPAREAAGAGAPASGPQGEAVAAAVEKLNDNPRFTAQGLRFSIDEESRRTVVRIVDSETQEVVRQIPSEDALALAHSIDKMQGLLLREKA